MHLEESDADRNPVPHIGSSRRVCLLRRLAKLLFWMPIVLAPLALLAIKLMIPDLNGNSIGDGFRKLSVWFAIVPPIAATCWAFAFSIQAYLDLQWIPSRRLWQWGIALVVLVLLIAVCAYLDL